MQRSTIEKLNQLNQSFYTNVAKEFDQTRQAPWHGWSNLVDLLDEFDKNQPLRVLDVGCGNGRFLDFLVKNVPEQSIAYTGIDLNSELLHFAKTRTQNFANLTTSWQHYDLVQTWLSGEMQKPPFDQKYDLIVVFGVMHHLPSALQRLSWLQNFQDHLSENGLLVVADWQFTRESKRFAEKTISPETLGISAAELESNDFILDWQKGAVSYRYCHETRAEEQAEQHKALVIRNPTVTLIKEFDADGKSGQLNHYRVWRSKKRSS